MKALSPEGFERAWGAEGLVRLPDLSATALVPNDNRTFLVRAGLPALIRPFPCSTEAVITFCRLASGLSPILEEKTVGPPLPGEWSVYWILGDEFFCNGAAWWCVHGSTGRVVRIDIEIEPPIEFANSSVAHFASAILAAWLWSSRCHRAAEDWTSEVDRLKRDLTELDPPSMDLEGNYWPMCLNFIRSEGPNVGAFEKGSRMDGERALQAGPW